MAASCQASKLPLARRPASSSIQPDPRDPCRFNFSGSPASRLRTAFSLAQLHVPFVSSIVPEVTVHRQRRAVVVSASQIDARGGDKLEAATAYLARKLVFEPYR